VNIVVVLELTILKKAKMKFNFDFMGTLTRLLLSTTSTRTFCE